MAFFKTPDVEWLYSGVTKTYPSNRPIVAAHTCSSGIVPPTVNLNEPDAGCELNHVIGEPRDANAKRVLSVSFGMGGQNAALILQRVTA